MKIEIKELKKSDYRKAIQFAVTGMHFDWYLDNHFLLYLYGMYFWYLELTRATQVFAAYVDDKFVGVLLAEMYGEERVYKSFWKTMYIKVFDFLQKTFYKGGAGLYDETTKAMLGTYLKEHSPDGELIFLAADPDCHIKGVGSRLLAELELKEEGKRIYLYTDNACTYQFYEHRGFQRDCETEIVLDMGKKQVPLICFIYSKVMKNMKNRVI